MLLWIPFYILHINRLNIMQKEWMCKHFFNHGRISLIHGYTSPLLKPAWNSLPWLWWPLNNSKHLMLEDDHLLKCTWWLRKIRVVFLLFYKFSYRTSSKKTAVAQLWSGKWRQCKLVMVCLATYLSAFDLPWSQDKVSNQKQTNESLTAQVFKLNVEQNVLPVLMAEHEHCWSCFLSRCDQALAKAFELGIWGLRFCSVAAKRVISRPKWR